MIEHLKSLAIFAEVAKEGSFRGAARKLNLTPSAISYHVRVLEDAVGTPILYRSTRSLSTTESGKILLTSAKDMIRAAEQGFSATKQYDANVHGKLNVTMTSALSHSHISKRIADFAFSFKNVDLHLHFDNRKNDLVGESFDLALRIGALENSGLICKLVWEMPRLLVISPKLIDEIGVINNVNDLEKLNWIRFETMTPNRRFIDVNGKQYNITQTGNITVNSIEAMVDMTLLGLGISSPPSHSVEEYIESGKLIQLMPEMTMQSLPVYAVWPPTKVPNPITRLFLDHITR